MFLIITAVTSAHLRTSVNALRSHDGKRRDSILNVDQKLSSSFMCAIPFTNLLTECLTNFIGSIDLLVS